ncbi:MAG: type VI secretion system baseplate subunit TssE, partial [Rhodobacterales bacterium]
MDRLDQMILSGTRTVDQAPDLDEAKRREIVQFLGLLARRAFLEDSGIVVT